MSEKKTEVARWNIAGILERLHHMNGIKQNFI
jgi:hypothetical protein